MTDSAKILHKWSSVGNGQWVCFRCQSQTFASPPDEPPADSFGGCTWKETIATLTAERDTYLKRLNISPQGDDEIDALESCIGFLRHDIEVLTAERDTRVSEIGLVTRMLNGAPPDELANDYGGLGLELLPLAESAAKVIRERDELRTKLGNAKQHAKGIVQGGSLLEIAEAILGEHEENRPRGASGERLDSELCRVCALASLIKRGEVQRDALRTTLEDRQTAAHTYGIAWAKYTNRNPSHREPMEFCPSPGCVRAREALGEKL